MGYVYGERERSVAGGAANGINCCVKARVGDRIAVAAGKLAAAYNAGVAAAGIVEAADCDSRAFRGGGKLTEQGARSSFLSV